MRAVGRVDRDLATIREKHADNHANVKNCMRRALELGINHFECANGYGTSELQMGDFLKEVGVLGRGSGRSESPV